jgi:tRNA A-37 threonylcarbamoyl transferase component Bud32
MPVTQDLQDERLVELLDEALCELRSGRPMDTMAWHERHPELGHEGASLLATLVRFATSVEDWRAALPLPRRSTRTPDGTAVEDSQVPEKIGRYVVVSRVGTGAMGTVYRAHDPQLDRLVAVKVPRMDKVPTDKGKFTERFLREARHAASVRNPHVCPIYDAGEHDGQPYVVMAYVDGEPLDRRLGRIGRFEDVRVAVRVGIQVAQALEAIHRHGIIHRDLKPANILIDRSGQALLTDFGLAREIEDAGKLTMEGIVVGTPSYMSPEQASGDNSNLGPASDLYSLGTVLYEMLTGQLPFKGSVLEVLRQIVIEQPASLLEHLPDLDRQLVELVLKSIAKNPADRFSTAASFAEALECWLDSASVSTEPDLAAAALPTYKGLEARAPATPAATPAALPPSPRYLGLKATHWLAAAALCLVAIPAVWLAAFGKGTEGQNAEDAVPGTQAAAFAARADAVYAGALSGQLKIKFIGHPRLDSDKATARRPEEGAPLFNGQLVQLQVALNRPGYAYVVWIDSDGTAQPIYPWDFGHSKALWDAPLVSGSEAPSDFVRCPQDAGKGFRATGKPGMQHVVLLARTTLLDRPDTLRPIFSGLPASPLGEGSQAARYFDWSPGQGTRSGLVRGLLPGAEDFTGETKEEPPTTEFGESELPVLGQLVERLRSCGFELIKVWRFPQKIE